MKTDFVRELRKSPVVVWGTINKLLPTKHYIEGLKHGGPSVDHLLHVFRPCQSGVQIPARDDFPD